MGEFFERFLAQKRRKLRRLTRSLCFFVCIQCSTVCAHQARNGRADDIVADFLLKRAQHGVVQERTALHDDLPADCFGIDRTDNFIQRVLDNADGKTRGDVLHRCLLRLLHGGVHEHRAAGAEVDRAIRKQTELCKIFNGVTQRTRKRLEERAAAGGTSLVEENIVDDAVFDLEALDVLTADVDDEIDLRVKRARRVEVRHRLYDAVIDGKRVFDDVFAVAGRRAGADLRLRETRVNFKQEFTHQRDRVAAVRHIARTNNIAVLIRHNGFNGRGARIDADINRLAVLQCVAHLNAGVKVALCKCFVIRLVFKKRRAGAVFFLCRVMRNAIDDLRKRRLIAVRRKRRTQRDEIQRIFRADARNAERLIKRHAQLAQKRHRAAEVYDLARDFSALRKTRNGLVHNGVENTCRHVFFLRALV